MVKKGQAKSSKLSGGAGSRKADSVPNGPDDSFIVFSNSDKEPKPKKLAGSNKASDAHPVQSGPSGAALAGEVAKRPDVKKLIGGASWTGKLPVNLLSEHCQKQRWEKPEYTMSKTPDGYSSMVIMKAKNLKTHELVQLPPFKLPPSHKYLAVKPTALEARHFAATYALFRVCSMRNIHMMLPPDYRDLWKGEFEVLKKEDVKDGRAWMYEADPFTTLREREDTKAAMEKKRIEREKAKEKVLNAPGGAGIGLAIHSKEYEIGGGTHNIQRGWTRVPTIDMGRTTREKVENLVRRHTIWNPNDVKISDFQRHSIMNEFKKLEFRESHIDEALDECKDREETLEWLLIHVPEDDLPGWALPKGYVAGVSMASSNLKREATVKRLSEAGYSLDLCKQILETHKDDEGKAAEALQKVLMRSGEAEISTPSPVITTIRQHLENAQSIWDEELTSLESVFGSNYLRASSDVCKINISPISNERHPPIAASIHIRRSSNYPTSVPIISITAPLPAYIRLSIIKKALIHASENLLGEQMIFFLVDWAEQNFFKIIERPGKLREVSAAASTVSEVRKHDRRITQRKYRHPDPIRWTPNPRSLEEWKKRQTEPRLQAYLKQRRSLPAWEMKDEIIDAINSNQVTIISGETGSGKSTQSAQFILDDLYSKGLGDATKIICTQPRRISALGLADRVSEERCSTVGQEVGYIIRGESKSTANTKITFVTTGVLLRRLQTSGGSSDDVVASLADISHVIIDEVHERSLDTDFLLALLRDVLRKRRSLKLILMSATLDAGVFEDYFRNDGDIGRIEISGRTFPVEDYYLDDVIRMTGFNSSRGLKKGEFDDEATSDVDSEVTSTIQGIGMKINYDLISQTVREIDAELSHINQEGGILIFLPGVAEINKTLDHLRYIPNLHALPLHASLQSMEQTRVFPHAPRGKRKVIVATNVAETSITIDDIVAVIDTGRVKETSYDPQNNMRKLEEVWASRAACKQRRGRAGRVQAGKCYKLYTRNAEMSKMVERPEPEIRRVPLEQLCLSVRAMGIKEVSRFLASALTPPESLAVDGAMELLGRMGALDGEDLTALGRHMSMIPADLRCGKLMVYGAMFGCLDACTTTAAILTIKSPFVSPQDKRDEAKGARSKFSNGHGDLVGDLHAFQKWEEMVGDRSVPQREVRNWCSDNFLSYQTLSDIASNKTQYMTSLREIGFIPSRMSRTSSFNRSDSNISLLRALIAGSFNPQLARIDFPDKKFAQSISGAVELDPEARTIKYFNQENGRVFVHPSSTLFDAQTFPGNAAYMSYFNKMATSKVFIRDLTPFNAYTALLFSGPISLDTLGRGLVVDGWLRLRGWARIGVLISRLRGMLDDVLARKIDDPDMDLGDNEIVKIVTKLVELDGMDQ